MCWGNSGTELVGMASQYLVQKKRPFHNRESMRGTARMARNHRLDSLETKIESNKTGKNFNEMISNDVLLY